MKYKNEFFWRVLASVFFVLATVLMIFSKTVLLGLGLLALGFLTSVYTLNKKKCCFVDKFFCASTILSLTLIFYTFLINYSKNVVIISASFYALNFLIQISASELRENKVLKKTILEIKELRKIKSSNVAKNNKKAKKTTKKKSSKKKATKKKTTKTSKKTKKA